jgi:hypothetical protein
MTLTPNLSESAVDEVLVQNQETCEALGVQGAWPPVGAPRGQDSSLLGRCYGGAGDLVPCRSAGCPRSFSFPSKVG